jgi:hypothetical protein
MTKKPKLLEPLKLTLYLGWQDLARAVCNGFSLTILPDNHKTTTSSGSGLSPVKTIGHGATRKPKARKK